MILKSRRKYTSSEDFRDKFLETLTPGVISRKGFIQWDTIFNKTDKYQQFFDFFRQIKLGDEIDCIKQIADALMASDSPAVFINTGFELLGHTGKNYVSDEDYIDFKTFSKIEKNEQQMTYIATVLVDLGICNILKLEIDDYFTGVQVGLETHRRKNVGGTAFSVVVKKELSEMTERLKSKGYMVQLTWEEKIYFSDAVTSKNLDFCLRYKEKIIGIEINFYTSPGSKPTEIKRSYGHVNRELEKVNASLVWVTDGVGYKSMKKSLKEAVDIHKNTYNFNMMKDFFEEDIINFFESQN